MQYQILEQSEPGEPWRFVAHGARYAGKLEAESAVALIEARGARARLIACGKPRKRAGRGRRPQAGSQGVRQVTGASWQSAAASVADSLERGAAKQVGALQPKPQTYMTDSGLLRVTFEGSPLALAWRLRGDPVARPDAIALIAQRMEARLG